MKSSMPPTRPGAAGAAGAADAAGAFNAAFTAELLGAAAEFPLEAATDAAAGSKVVLGSLGVRAATFGFTAAGFAATAAARGGCGTTGGFTAGATGFIAGAGLRIAAVGAAPDLPTCWLFAPVFFSPKISKRPIPLIAPPIFPTRFASLALLFPASRRQ